MIAFEVSLNGIRICTAGANDLGVLSTIVSAHGKLGKKAVPYRPDATSSDVHYTVGGLTSRPAPKKDVHLRWKSVAPLQVGDIIQVKVLETTKVDRPREREYRDHTKDLRSQKQYVRQMAKKFGWKIIPPN